uniref:intraflagellar transport protein 88 homolog isoform X3 n=1 Tax=Halichoerus grypus TaxID=9711 RepID=UPI001659CE5E|nr:intraflagellar transport protein 88 homolog isoform X3 [Halichoerus grypus]
MMQNVHLAPETDEDDLYSGYNDYNPTYDTEELENDTAFQQAVRTSHGRRLPITAKIPSTAVTRPIATGYGSKTSLASSMGRPMTGAIQDGITRPMTAVRAAGFTKAALRGSAFDPLGQSRGPAPPLEAKNEDRIKIMQNIGVTFIKTGQYSDAINSFEHIMSMAPNLKAGFNLILSYFAVGDRDKMKKAFQKLIAVPLEIDEDDKYISPSDDPHTNLVIEAIKNDHLRQMERERKAMAEKYIMTAAKLIAPVIETSFAVGYDWCVEVVKASQYVELANDLEINKAITYLRQKDFNQAVETLKMFEKKDSRVKSAAATNLSFLYYLENEFAQASSYADLAVNSDRYNPSALTNKGNTVFANGDYEKAAEFYKEALRNDSSCTEALYNIGLTYKRLNRLDEALDCFLKLHAILRNSAQVLYQIANVYELMEDPNQAIEWLMQLISVVPTDSRALSKLGELYDSEGDKSQAFQYYYESYRYFPSNIEVIEWLGAYYIDTQFCEKAIQYFERASLIQPTQVKWQLMVASCFRRSGLRFLVRLCTDIGLKEVQEYATKLKRLEKMKEIREQRIKSGRDSSGGSRSRREGSAGSDSGQNCSASSKGERLSAKLRALPGTNEPYESSSNKEIDASYVDPLGPQIERPKTAAKKRIDEDDFADEELGDDLLPE